jgi:hypothetical protein
MPCSPYCSDGGKKAAVLPLRLLGVGRTAAWLLVNSRKFRSTQRYLPARIPCQGDSVQDARTTLPKIDGRSWHCITSHLIAIDRHDEPMTAIPFREITIDRNDSFRPGFKVQYRIEFTQWDLSGIIGI